jgi:hypothetical protein
MNVERARRLLSNLKCSRQELESLLKEAIAANERELAYDIKDVIEERFPQTGRSRGGPAETVARYKGMERRFPTAIDAYIWLVERFIGLRPEVFTDIKWKTTGYVAVGQRRSEGHAIRNYFARSPAKLFRQSPHLAGDLNNYCELSNGWYANKNLSNAQKFDILCRFGWVVGLKWGGDWDWEVLDPSEQLADRKERTRIAEKALDELDILLAKSQT